MLFVFHTTRNKAYLILSYLKYETFGCPDLKDAVINMIYRNIPECIHMTYESHIKQISTIQQPNITYQTDENILNKGIHT